MQLTSVHTMPSPVRLLTEILIRLLRWAGAGRNRVLTEQIDERDRERDKCKLRFNPPRTYSTTFIVCNYICAQCCQLRISQGSLHHMVWASDTLKCGIRRMGGRGGGAGQLECVSATILKTRWGGWGRDASSSDEASQVSRQAGQVQRQPICCLLQRKRPSPADTI